MDIWTVNHRPDDVPMVFVARKMVARRTDQRRPLRRYRVRASTRCATICATVAELGKA